MPECSARYCAHSGVNISCNRLLFLCTVAFVLDLNITISRGYTIRDPVVASFLQYPPFDRISPQHF